MSFRDEVKTQSGLDGMRNFSLKKSEAPHTSQFLQWEKGHTLVRIYPYFENGNEMPWRLSADPGHYTPWIRGFRTVRSMGVNDKFTCFANVLNKPLDYEGPIDKMQPVLKSSIDNAPKRHFPVEWEEYLEGGKGKQANIPRIDTYGIVQGMLFESGGKQFLSKDNSRYDPKHPVLLCLNKSARQGLQRLCDAERENYTGPREDYNARFACGDLFSCAGGKLVKFYAEQRTESNFSKYGVAIDQPCPLDPALVAREFWPWDKLIRFLTEEEQMNLIVQHFPPELVDFLYANTQWKDLLPAGVLGKSASLHRQSVVAPQVQQVQPQVQQVQPQVQPPATFAFPSPGPAPDTYNPERFVSSGVSGAGNTSVTSALPPGPAVPSSTQMPAPGAVVSYPAPVPPQPVGPSVSPLVSQVPVPNFTAPAVSPSMAVSGGPTPEPPVSARERLREAQKFLEQQQKAKQ
jgi:hypothetical protein